MGAWVHWNNWPPSALVRQTATPSDWLLKRVKEQEQRIRRREAMESPSSLLLPEDY